MFHAEMIAEHLGISPSYLLTGAVGGATPPALLHHAAAAVALGVCKTVMLIVADNLLSGIASHWGSSHRGYEIEQFEHPYGPIMPRYIRSSRAPICMRMERLVSSWRQLPVACRKHASLNPTAQRRDPITIQDVVNSRMIAEPLHLLDCAQVSDGGAAVIITSAERARDFKQKPVYLLGAGEAYWHYHLSHAPSLTSTAATDSGARAFAMAGLKPKDMDVAELYDAFTPIVIIQLEDLGFCGGRGGPFVQHGRIEIGGELPVCTHGGLLSHCHPGFPGSTFNIVEAVRQLRDECGARQVRNAEIALVQGQGGASSSHCTLILGKER